MWGHAGAGAEKEMSIEQMKVNLQSTENTIRGSVASIKALSVDATLSVDGAAADAKVVGERLEQVSEHIADGENPHGVTKSQIGLGEVDNTSDADKPVSIAQAEAILSAKQAGVDAMTEAKRKVEKTNATATLSASGWSGGSQTVTVQGVTVSNTIIVGSAPENYNAYAEANVRCTAQGSNSLTFQCDDTPSENLTVNVMILE